MKKYKIKNATKRKVKNRGWTPVWVWQSGWYAGWRVKTGTKLQHIFIQHSESMKKFPLNTKLVKDMEKLNG